VNQQYGQAGQSLLSQLAKAGALNSGRAATSLTNLNLGKLGQLGNYNAQVPIQNAQYSTSGLQGALGLMSGFKPAYGSTTTNNSLQQILNQLNTQNQSNTQGTSQTKSTNSSGLLGSLFG